MTPMWFLFWGLLVFFGTGFFIGSPKRELQRRVSVGLRFRVASLNPKP